jgi:hypothetical protein
MKKLLPLAAFIAALFPFQVNSQDMAVAQKWANAKLVKYRVEGVHKARIMVVQGDYEGKADVTDRVTVEYTWDVQKGKVSGAVKAIDAKTEVTNIKSDGTNCPPPTLKASYEHFTTVSSGMMEDLIEIKGTRVYPAAMVSNYPGSCSMRAIPGGTVDAVLHFGGVAPEVLAMPNMPGSPVTIAADRKSFTVKGAENWSWTFFPTLVN